MPRVMSSIPVKKRMSERVKYRVFRGKNLKREDNKINPLSNAEAEPIRISIDIWRGLIEKIIIKSNISASKLENL